jgi:Tfp pilus assembly protein PilF
MKKILLIFACALVFSSAANAQKTAWEYSEEGLQYFLDHEYEKAILPLQKAFEMEQDNRTFSKSQWFILVESLAMCYREVGDSKASFPVLEYGVSQDPTYPLFYYNIARGYGELGEEDNAITYLRITYTYKDNMMIGERFPNPEKDSSFEKFRNSDKFKKAIKQMKGGQ